MEPDELSVRSRRLPRGLVLVVVACLLVFVAAGLAFIPQLGLQEDEALFAPGVYEPGSVAYSVRVFGAPVPVMLMPYVGALKAWIYKPLLAVWRPSPFSVRLPALLAGAGTICLFFLLLVRCAGMRAAVAGVVLLATDSVFLLTTCFDWGPVALLHLLLFGGALLMVLAHQRLSSTCFAWACFLLGLALWMKAVFVWLLLGLAAGLVASGTRQFRRFLHCRALMIGGLAFVLGAAPLLLYNIARGWQTFRPGAAPFSVTNVPRLASVFRDTLNGSVLFGYLVRNESPQPTEPAAWWEDASVSLSAAFGPERSLGAWVFALTVLLAPFAARGRARGPIVFGVVLLLAAWLAMILSGGGGAAHHTILLWPFPHWVMAIVLAELTKRGSRFVLPCLLAVLAASNLLVMNRYYAHAVRHGSGSAWTDAIYSLSDYLDRTHPREAILADWGMHNSLILLHQNRLKIRAAFDANGDDLHTLAHPDNLFVTRVPGEESFEGAQARLLDLAKRSGYSKTAARLIRDRNARPIFEVFALTESHIIESK